jgi:hypothetical protein
VEPGATIPLTITGNLYEESSGTPITGQDCIKVLGVKLTPGSMTVPHRERLRFQVTATGNGDDVGFVYFATRLTLPNGKKYPPSGFLFGPRKLTLDAYESISGNPSLAIPVNAPLGIYTYHSYVGRPVEGIFFEDQFQFEVTGE